jgi:hypothetical protein
LYSDITLTLQFVVSVSFCPAPQTAIADSNRFLQVLLQLLNSLFSDFWQEIKAEDSNNMNTYKNKILRI